MVKSLLSNAHYAKLTPSGNKIDEILKAGSLLVYNGAPSMFCPNLCKSAGAMKDLAFNTTSLTYALHKVYLAIPKLATDILKSQAASELKVALDAKHFAVPAALAKRIAALAELAEDQKKEKAQAQAKKATAGEGQKRRGPVSSGLKPSGPSPTKS